MPLSMVLHSLSHNYLVKQSQVKQMASELLQDLAVLCWIEAIYITDIFHYSCSHRNAGCTLSQLGLIAVRPRRVKKRKRGGGKWKQDNYKENDTSEGFCSRNMNLALQCFSGPNQRCWKWWCHVIRSPGLSKCEVWELCGAIGDSRGPGLDSKGCHAGRDGSHPSVCPS